MGATTVRRGISRMGDDVLPSTVLGKVAGSSKVLRGWLCLKNSSGFVVSATATAGLTSAGVSLEDADNSSGSDGDLAVALINGPVDLAIGTSTDALVDSDAPCACYAMDNQTVGKQPASAGTVRSRAGVFLGINADTGMARVLVGPAGEMLAKSLEGKRLQSGTATLVAGTVTVNTGITITSSSKVFVSLNTVGGGTEGAKYAVPDSGLVVGGPGTGAFTINAESTAGALVNTDTSTINYLIVG